MNATKYDAMDVHTATISIAVLSCDGRLIRESVIEANRNTIVQFIQGLRGELFLTSVYHGKNGLPTLKELAGAYLTITKDLNGVKAIYRSWGIPCAGQSVYHPRQRQEWLRKIPYIEDPDSA